jgi:peptidoglycan/xylan/chitin deacetylase (PgdA/CDA1 family)
LLPLLQRYTIPATFFVIGENARHYEHVLQDVHARGHEIENHGYQHIKFTRLLREHGRDGVRRSLEKTADIVMRITGRAPRFFRPPFWDSTDELEQVVQALGYRMMKIGNPDINTLDYDDVAHKRPPQMLAERVRQQVGERAHRGVSDFVLVLHERHLTVDALAIAIPHLQEAGYTFCRLDALL